jgi:DNA (cytosine-5)-methyltransferase 1
MKLGSLCSGIGGLEIGLQLAGLETETVFVSDIDDGANAWLAANVDAPNLGDFTKLDELPEVDIITAGFPCQPFSLAGARDGLNDERYLFDDIARLVGRMGTRPLLFLENVPGLLTTNDRHAFSRLVHSLAAIRYCLTYGLLSAASVGAPHLRLRWWGLAYPANTDSPRRKKHGRPVATRTKLDTAEHASNRARFGNYGEAISRWELTLGRPAPDPVDDGKLSPPFVEWMMGYPEGWVTDTLTSRRQALHALGNAVVPQCAAEAFTQLTERRQ